MWYIYAELLSAQNTYNMEPIMPKTLNNPDPNKYYLSKEEKEFYAENGYLVIKKLFDRDTLDSFRQRFQEICNNESLRTSCSVLLEKKLISVNSKPEDYVNKIQDILSDRVFSGYNESARVLHVVSQVLGCALTALNCSLINKPPGATRHPAHQDGIYFPIHPMSALGVWTALDASSVSNGCLYCVPGSHKLGLLKHKPFKDSKKFYHVITNEAQFAPADKRIHLEMSPGDTVLLHPYLVHGSGPNISGHCRKAMTAHYMGSDCQYIDLRGTERGWLVRDWEETVQLRGNPGRYETRRKLKSKVLPTVRCHL